MLARTANEAWVAANLGRWWRFSRALSDPGRHQLSILKRLLEVNADTEFGRRHRFESIDSVEAYRRRVPLSVHDDYGRWIDGIRSGRQGLLTREPVRRLVPSGGSTGRRKLIPFTDSLLGEFNRAIGPWVADLYRACPDLKRGPSYWSISPAAPASDEVPSAVPIGFDDDSAYLGGLLRRVVERSLAVPAAVRDVDDIAAFRYVTSRHLLARPDLRLISVWHPSFLTLLLESLDEYWDALVEDVERGTLDPPTPIRPSLQRVLGDGLAADPKRAEELRRTGPVPSRIWPRLGLISCWADGHAGEAVARLEALFPRAEIQPKGLVATECFVTLPFRGAWPLAVRSHFYEFVDDAGRVCGADELIPGGEYSVVVTTGGGLYRYQLGDRVRVEGIVASTPSLRFQGRSDRSSDRFGEKLTDAFVTRVLGELLQPYRTTVSFAMLAPDKRAGKLAYTLFLEIRDDPSPELAERLEVLLGEEFHYRYCVRLGQLAPARVFRIVGDAYGAYVDALRQKGQRIGDVKPSALSPDANWRSRFDGSYVDRSERGASPLVAASRV